MKKSNPSSKEYGVLRRPTETFLEKDPPAGENSRLGEVKDLVEDLRIHQVMPEMQNEELRRAYEELEKAKDLYEDLFDFAPVGYLSLDEHNLVYRVNLTAANFLGLERRRLVGSPFSRFVLPDWRDHLYYFCRQCLDTRTRQTCDLKIQRADGTVRHVQLEGTAVSDEKGRLNRVRISMIDVTERRLHEEQSLNRNRLLWGINRIFRDSLACETEEDTAKVCLTVVEELTGSSFGLIWEINAHERLDCVAVSDPGWDACNIPQDKARQSLQGLQVKGYWETVIREGKCLIVNAPGSYHQALRIPEGHPQITSFMGLPLYRGNRVYGMVAVANKEGGYSVLDRENMETLAPAVVECLIQKRYQRNIHVLGQEVLKAQENERQMISRELHDRIAQDLSAVKMGYDSLLAGQGEITERTIKKSSELSRVLQNSIMAVRDLSYELRPPDLERTGIVETLFQLCSQFSQRTGILVDFFSVGMENILLEDFAMINIYRLVQEGLNNVLKHAEASHVDVRFSYAHPDIMLSIADNGKGFDVEKRLATMDSDKRMGLRSMQERAGLLGGKMEVRSKPMHGTTVQIRLPYGENRHG